MLSESDCTILYTNLHAVFCQFISWTNWVNSGKFMDNCWISCQVMAGIEKVYDDLIIVNLYRLKAPLHCSTDMQCIVTCQIEFSRYKSIISCGLKTNYVLNCLWTHGYPTTTKMLFSSSWAILIILYANLISCFISFWYKSVLNIFSRKKFEV